MNTYVPLDCIFLLVQYCKYMLGSKSTYFSYIIQHFGHFFHHANAFPLTNLLMRSMAHLDWS